MKPVILLDIDGVCADFITPVLEAVYEITGIAYDVSDVTGWDIAKSLNLSVQDAGFLDDRISERYFCSHLQLYPGALEGVQELRKFADVYAVTSPFDSEHWMREREVWLQQNLDFSRENIIFTSAKHLVNGNVLIDDKTSTVIKWETANTYKSTGFVFSRPWNSPDPFERRFSDWPNAVAYLKRIFK